MVTEPEDMEQLVYFTRRTLGDKGKVMAWVYRKECPKCKKGVMGKPLKPNGTPKIRADEYECPKCNYNVQKKEYEETLELEATYVCPHCKKDGEASVPFKRKKIEGVDTIRLTCTHCKGNIDVTKKMKEK